VVGLPKTIDNDIPFVRQTFGFESAVEIACQAVSAAHEEARGARNGIGLVKFMGRHSGYIAANVALATGNVNYCLVPEVPFLLEGDDGLLANLEKRLASAGHAVIAVAEGAGQYYFKGEAEARDKSGNVRLKDIGTYLNKRISEHFQSKSGDFTLKYIDPSYLIRGTAANAADRLFCAKLARNAVHAAMAGKTAMLIGYWHGRVTHIPFAALEGQRQTINPNGELWFNVLESTGQPQNIGNPKDLAAL
jgi:6-phosphofructokinase 1